MTCYKPKELKYAKIGYVPMGKDLTSPGDKRRFVYYANKRNLRFEFADPFKQYDVVVITQSADLSVWCKYDGGGSKIIYDFIDSYLTIPKSNVKGMLRGLAKYFSGQSKYLKIDHWKAIEQMCGRADAVVCSTIEQSAKISKFCQNVYIILDAHMGVAKRIKDSYIATSPFKLVWEGLPQNLTPLMQLKPVLDKLSVLYSVEFELHIVTDVFFFRHLNKFGKKYTLHEAQLVFPNVHFHEWKEDNVAKIICSCDLAVIPLNLKDLFASGKPENKLLLFWRLGMPVVTSASPAYVRAMQAAGLKYTAIDELEWLAHLSSLICDINSRESAGVLGKEYVKNNFSEAILMSRWDAVFESLGFSCG